MSVEDGLQVIVWSRTTADFYGTKNFPGDDSYYQGGFQGQYGPIYGILHKLVTLACHNDVALVAGATGTAASIITASGADAFGYFVAQAAADVAAGAIDWTTFWVELITLLTPEIFLAILAAVAIEASVIAFAIWCDSNGLD